MNFLYTFLFLCFPYVLQAAELIEQSEALELSRIIPMPLNWQERGDIFNSEQDLIALLRKCQISGTLPIKNNTNTPISIRIYGKIDASSETTQTDFFMNPSEIITTDFSFYENLHLCEESKGFINLTFNHQFEICIESIPVLLFPRLIKDFSFIPKKKSNTTTINEASKQYYNSLEFLRNFVLRFEEINFADFFAQRERLYTRYRLEEISALPLPQQPYIPLNIFNIWLTAEDDPKELPPLFIEMMKHNSRVNPRCEGWNYYLLVQDPDLLPCTKAALENTDIQMIRYLDLLDSLDLHDELMTAMTQKNFGKASDILRAEVLIKFGGVYLDHDLRVFHSLKPYCHLYDSVFGIQPMDEYLGNAFMACSPNHPVIRELVQLIKRNRSLVYDPVTFSRLTQIERKRIQSFYANTSSDRKANTVHITGPTTLTIAFYNAAEKENKKNIALPPEVIYPGRTAERPTNEIPSMEDPLRLDALCVHYWAKTWI